MSSGRIACDGSKTKSLEGRRRILCVGCYASHITVVTSKAAHSGPSVCLRTRAPCPLRVSRPEVVSSRDVQQACCTLSVQRELQILALPRLVKTAPPLQLNRGRTPPPPPRPRTPRRCLPVVRCLFNKQPYANLLAASRAVAEYQAECRVNSRRTHVNSRRTHVNSRRTHVNSRRTHGV
jgi:hypothetical protein